MQHMEAMELPSFITGERKPVTVGAGLESQFWAHIRDTNKSLGAYLERVENSVSLGMPDVHGVWELTSFWLELKVGEDLGDRIRARKVRPEQVTWQMNYAALGGKVATLVRVRSGRSPLDYLVHPLNLERLKSGKLAKADTLMLTNCNSVSGLEAMLNLLVA